MGHFAPFHDDQDFPVEDQIKELQDDELLDFWEQSQRLEKFLQEEFNVRDVHTVEYERLIVQELQLRASRKGARG